MIDTLSSSRSFSPAIDATISAEVPFAAPPRILIVEDEQLIALDIKRRIEGFGYGVVGIAGDSDTAQAMVKDLAPDLVLMDVRLQGQMDGIEIVERLQEEVDVPVIFITGNADEATLRRAEAVHPFNFIVKPIRDRELKITVAAALHHYRLVRELWRVKDELAERVQARTAALAETNRRLEAKIVAHVELERELLRARALTEAASAAKFRFFANVSHQIRTPMNGIVGMADVLSGTTLTAEQEESLDLMRSCACDLLGTVDGLIQFSELASGNIPLEAKAVDLRDVLPQVVRSLKRGTRVQRVAFRCSLAPEIPAVVYADPLRLGQLVQHLMVFLVNSMGEGEVRLQCECIDQNPGQVHLHLSVRDNSGGLEQAVQRRVNRMFNQPNTILSQVEDLGLSLAIPSLLMHAMGGVLWLDTVPGVGNTLHAALWLPTSVPNSTTAI